MKRNIGLILTALMLFTLIGCGSNDNSAWNENFETSSEDYYVTSDNTMDMGGIEFNESIASTEESATPEVDSLDKSVELSTRKIIKSASMEIQTLEYELAVQRLSDKIKGIGGYIESSNVRGRAVDDKYSTRSAHYTLRIPQQQFLQFMSDMNTIGTIIQENSYGEDITAQYFDTEAHMKTLEVQEERLLDILRKAEIIEDVITLERELSSIRYQIEGLTGNLNRWDNLVSYSTLSISIYEVEEIVIIEEPAKTLGEKISQKFGNSMDNIKDFFEGLAIVGIGSLPLLIIYVPLFLILFITGRKVYRKMNPKQTVINAKEEEKNNS